MKTAVLLGTMGGPQQEKDVKGFLFRLFSDPALLSVPAPFRQLLAAVIAQLRAPKSRARYMAIGGGSPLVPEMQAQAQGLEGLLGEDWRVQVAALYAPPFVEDVVAALVSYKPDRVILLPFYPQYAAATSGAFLARARKALDRLLPYCPVEVVESFAQSAGFAQAIAMNIRPLLEEGVKTRLLFSAHSLPVRHVLKSELYPLQCVQSQEAVFEALAEPSLEQELCYQSRTGPGRWLGPSFYEALERAARDRRAILVVPLSFACENVETLCDLALEGRVLAQSMGVPSYKVVPTAACAPCFLEDLARILTEK
ncbi:MAG: ferrochelatase [Alphaproteobacteria bacterium]|nr:ferrochelatase [Alphaproteobacteria bacterium]